MIRRVGFIGLGIMGEAMARNVLKAGFALKVWNRTAKKCDAIAIEGARRAATPAAVAAASDVTISCVTDSPDVREVTLGRFGVGEGAAPGSCYVDCSTISPAVAREVAAALSVQGIGVLDAPVSGGDVGARAGTLAIMVGGPEDVFRRCLPVLQAMGKTVVHVGPSGAGQVVKLCNQVAGGLNLLAMAEAVTLARRAGVDPAKMIEVVGAGAAGSWMLSNLGPRALQGDFAPGFMIELMQKDLRLVMETAAETRTPLPGAALVREVFRMLEARGRGREGTQAIVEALRLMAVDG